MLRIVPESEPPVPALFTLRLRSCASAAFTAAALGLVPEGCSAPTSTSPAVKILGLRSVEVCIWCSGPDAVLLNDAAGAAAVATATKFCSAT